MAFETHGLERIESNPSQTPSIKSKVIVQDELIAELGLGQCP